MSEDLPPLNRDAANAGSRPSLIAELRALQAEARTYAEAELAWQKARATHLARNAKGVAALGALALALAFCALMALVFGLVLGLSSLIGPWGATAVATIALLLVAALCAGLAAGRLRRTMTEIDSDG